MNGANSTEFDQLTPYPVVAMVQEWLNPEGVKEIRAQGGDLGGTMRLGAQECLLAENSLARKVYATDKISERHRHRYEVNNLLLPKLEQAGLKVSGRSVDGELVEMIELENHPWFMACQFHPEFKSTPRDGHPLFIGFVKAALEHQSKANETTKL